MEAVAEDDDVEIAERVGEEVVESQSMSMSLSAGRRGESLRVEEGREGELLLSAILLLPLQLLLLLRPSRSSIGLTPDEAERKAQDSEKERQREFLKRREIRLAEVDPSMMCTEARFLARIVEGGQLSVTRSTSVPLCWQDEGSETGATII